MTPPPDSKDKDEETKPARAFVERRKKPLGACVEIALAHYFNDLDGNHCNDLYEMVLGEVEPPLLRAVLNHTRGNQSRTAEILGINRNTLRKKIEKYGITIPRRKAPSARRR